MPDTRRVDNAYVPTPAEMWDFLVGLKETTVSGFSRVELLLDRVETRLESVESHIRVLQTDVSRMEHRIVRMDDRLSRIEDVR
jgi:hypothetical protein